MENEDEKPKTKSEEKLALIEQAREIAERLEQGNKEAREILEEHKKIEAFKALGGKTDAVPTAQPKEETAKEYAARVMSGKLAPQ